MNIYLSNLFYIFGVIFPAFDMDLLDFKFNSSLRPIYSSLIPRMSLCFRNVSIFVCGGSEMEMIDEKERDGIILLLILYNIILMDD